MDNLTHNLTHDADIIVAGAGVAGTTAAAVLSQQGWRVLLLDARSTCPPVFKAEKMLRDELRVLRDFKLLEPVLPHCAQISDLYDAYDGRIFRHCRVEQIGLPYADLVNTLRANLPPAVETRVGRVDRITRDGGTARVHLAGGEELTARLVVLACGVSGELPASLGLRRRVIQKEQCVVLGFNVESADSGPFAFESVTYYPTEAASGIDYLTLFKFRDTMRANLFTFRSGNDPWIREFLKEPGRLLEGALPKLRRVIGDYRVVSKVESGCADLYRMEGDMPEGVVLIGDALQSVCPSTGLGLRKVMTDVEVLAECVPEWFATPGMSAAKLGRFYEDPRKRAVDAHALHDARQRRGIAVGSSLWWRAHRALLHLRWSFLRPRQLPAHRQARKANPAIRGLDKPEAER